jgi:hypothetical protein
MRLLYTVGKTSLGSTVKCTAQTAVEQTRRHAAQATSHAGWCMTEIYKGSTVCFRRDMSRGSIGCCWTDTSGGSLGCCLTDTSRGSIGCCWTDTSRGSIGCCWTDTSRGSSGCITCRLVQDGASLL